MEIIISAIVVLLAAAWGVGLLRAIPREQASERLKKYCADR